MERANKISIFHETKDVSDDGDRYERGEGGEGEGGTEMDLTRGRQRLGPLNSDTCDSSTKQYTT